VNPEAGKSIAAAFSMAGFTVAVVSGLAVDNPVTRTMQCALVSMVLCYLAGLVISAIALRVASEHVDAYKAAHPIGGVKPPDEEKAVSGAGTP
jgi:hypothetical protein